VLWQKWEVSWLHKSKKSVFFIVTVGNAMKLSGWSHCYCSWSALVVPRILVHPGSLLVLEAEMKYPVSVVAVDQVIMLAVKGQGPWVPPVRVLPARVLPPDKVPLDRALPVRVLRALLVMRVVAVAATVSLTRLRNAMVQISAKRHAEVWEWVVVF